MRQIQIQVYASVDCKINNKVLFERIVDINDSIDIPFNVTLNALKFMFGSSAVISFNLL